MYVPIGSWRPDQPKYPVSGSTTCKNVIPRTKTETNSGIPEISYGAFSQITKYASALSERIQGATSAIDSSGHTHIFAGTASGLYELTSGTTFTDVTRTSGAYSTPSSATWNFTQFGDAIIASNYNDDIQVYTMGTSSNFEALGSGVPKGKIVTRVKDFLFLGYTNDSTNGELPSRVWWSAQNDPSSFPTPGTASAAQLQSDYQPMPSEYGRIMGIVGGLNTSDGAIFMERAIYRVNYSGPPTFFKILPAVGAKGTPATNSLVQAGSLIYYLGEDGFYAFDGTNTKPIGTERIDKFFFDDLDQNYFERIIGESDPINKIIYWSYPDKTNTGGLCNKIIAYNWSIDEWSLIEHDTEFLFRGLSIGYTLSDLDAFGTLGTLEFPLGSRVWMGTSIILGGFDSSHQMGYFTGTNLTPVVETGEIQFTKDMRSVITNAKPIITAKSGSTITPQIAMGYRNKQTEAITYKSYVSENANGDCPQRTAGRYFTARLTTASGDDFDHIEGVELAGVAEGER